MDYLQNAASKGRNGDDMLMHVSRAEVAGLAKLAHDQGLGEMTVNPETGLPEAFLFTPLLAGMFAPGLGATIGGSLGLTGLAANAVGSGLLGAGLGTAEAAVRGMDDPLKQGLMAGGMGALGGAAQSILGGAGAAGAEAINPAPNLAGANPNVAAGATQMGAGVQPPGSMIPTQATALPKPPLSGAGVKPMAPSAGMNPNALINRGIGMGGGAPVVPSAPATPGLNAGPSAGATPGPIARPTPGPTPAPVQTATPTPAAGGAPGAAKPGFMDKATGWIKDNPELAIAGGLGAGIMMDSASRGSEMEDQYNEGKRKRAADERVARDMIRGSYDRAGRTMPTGLSGKTRFGDDPIFYAAQGGMVPPTQQYGCGGKVHKYGQGGLAALPQGQEMGGMYLDGFTDGMSDSIPAQINGSEPAELSDGEFVIPADVVSHLGNGSSNAGAQQLYDMMARIREARTGNPQQGQEIQPQQYMPA